MAVRKSIPQSTDTPSRRAAKPKPAPKPRPKTDFTFHTPSAEESYSDGVLLVQFTIPGRPATKKTHQNLIWVKGHPRIIPSKQYQAYEKLCKEACHAAWADHSRMPMDFGVSIHLRIVLDNWSVGDHTGYMQALGDILQEHGVIANDMWIHWADDGIHWLAAEPDKENPRVEVTIRRFRHPKETFRENKEAMERRRLERKALKTSDATPETDME